MKNVEFSEKEYMRKLLRLLLKKISRKNRYDAVVKKPKILKHIIVSFD